MKRERYIISELDLLELFNIDKSALIGKITMDKSQNIEFEIITSNFDDIDNDRYFWRSVFIKDKI